MCVTHQHALWWVRLRPGSDDSSELSGCLWVKRICAHIVTHAKISSWAGGVPCIENVFVCVDVIYSCLDWNEIKYCGRDIKALLTRSYIYLLSDCFVFTFD